MNDMISIPKAEYERLVIASEDLADLQAVEDFIVAPRPGLPSELVARMIDGESLLKLWREHRELSQNKLAQMSNVNRVQIGDIEGQKKTGSVETLKKLADTLDIRVDDLLAN